LLVDLLRLPTVVRHHGGWQTFRDDLAGFVVGWVLVIVLVAATALFLAA
jgi:hypothetical protein